MWSRTEGGELVIRTHLLMEAGRAGAAFGATILCLAEFCFCFIDWYLMTCYCSIVVKVFPRLLLTLPNLTLLCSGENIYVVIKTCQCAIVTGEESVYLTVFWQIQGTDVERQEFVLTEVNPNWRQLPTISFKTTSQVHRRWVFVIQQIYFGAERWFKECAVL